MIAIDNVLISDDIVEKEFVCNLNKCKGACCEDGDAGAPLSEEELDILINEYEVIKPYLTEEGINIIESQGKYYYDKQFGWVTTTIKDKMCAYGFRDHKGIIKCGIEQAYYDGKLKWKKPISCHLFPIRISKSKEDSDLEYVNYEPREDSCTPACNLGRELKIPVYKFLKEAISRKYGEQFYNTLEATANHIKEASKVSSEK